MSAESRPLLAILYYSWFFESKCISSHQQQKHKTACEVLTHFHERPFRIRNVYTCSLGIDCPYKYVFRNYKVRTSDWVITTQIIKLPVTSSIIPIFDLWSSSCWNTRWCNIYILHYFTYEQIFTLVHLINFDTRFSHLTFAFGFIIYCAYFSCYFLFTLAW